MTPLAENLPASSRLERQLYFVTRQLAGGWLKVWIGSIAASGLRNLNDCSRSDPAFGARPQQHLVWLAACGLGAATELSWFGDGNRP
jgi:hypothetical protein